MAAPISGPSSGRSEDEIVAEAQVYVGDSSSLGGDEDVALDSGDPNDPSSLAYDPSLQDSGDPNDPNSIAYDPSLQSSRRNLSNINNRI